MMKNFFTIDLEDWYQVTGFQKQIKFSDWPACESRLEKSTDTLLSTLSKFGVKATFFVVGYLAERHPELILRISNQGHEVASHGYAHQLVYAQSPEEFEKDLRKSIEVISNILNKPIYGYRAPSYSVPDNHDMFFKILARNGIKYDASVLPGKKPSLRKYAGTPSVIFEKDDHVIVEYPVSTFPLPGFHGRYPFCGGGYLRLLPYPIVRAGINRLNSENIPVVVYVHPWELDTGQPRVKTDLPRHFKHYVNIGDSYFDKINILLSEFSFGKTELECGER